MLWCICRYLVIVSVQPVRSCSFPHLRRNSGILMALGLWPASVLTTLSICSWLPESPLNQSPLSVPMHHTTPAWVSWTTDWFQSSPLPRPPEDFNNCLQPLIGFFPLLGNSCFALLNRWLVSLRSRPRRRRRSRRKEAKASFPSPLAGRYRLGGTALADRLAASSNHKDPWRLWFPELLTACAPPPPWPEELPTLLARSPRSGGDGLRATAPLGGLPPRKKQLTPHRPLKKHCFLLNPRKSGLWHSFPPLTDSVVPRIGINGVRLKRWLACRCAAAMCFFTIVLFVVRRLFMCLRVTSMCLTICIIDCKHDVLIGCSTFRC